MDSQVFSQDANPWIAFDAFQATTKTKEKVQNSIESHNAMKSRKKIIAKKAKEKIY